MTDDQGTTEVQHEQEFQEDADETETDEIYVAVNLDDDIYDSFNDSDVEVSGEDEVLSMPDIDSEPLYPGASITIGAMMLLLALFFTKQNIVGEGIQQLLSIIGAALPNGHLLCTSLNTFRNYFKNLKNPLIKHYYCSYCLGYLKDNSLETCPFLNCGKRLSEDSKEYFLEMPVKSQLASLFSQEGFYSSMEANFHRKRMPDLNDIYQGTLYRKYVENSGPLSSPDNISFTFNTDGAAVFKSSNVSVWPLFLVINELPYKLRMKKDNMILAGLWFGNKKPSMATYMKPFQESFDKLAEGCTFYSPERGEFECKAFLLCGTADLPARCILCNSVQFNGSFSCWKCLQKGETAKVGKGHCHVFPYKDDSPKTPVRTKESVLNDSQKAMDLHESGIAKYLVNGIKGPSWLSFFPKFDIVEGIAIDYMHGVLLGVQKLLLSLWFSDTHKGKPFNLREKLCDVDKRLLSIKPTLNISRLPRSIQNDLKYWKASEFRSFLLYYGAPVLNGILDKERFCHYLLLVNSVFMLLKTKATVGDIAAAESMLFQFVKHFAFLYDKCHMTLNIHQLVHLADSVLSLGPLYTHSCFSFEDKNGILLRMIRGTQNIDNQIITGVSFLQKLPELKQKTISKGSELEKLYNSIEQPCSLSRGLEITEGIFVLGAIKLKILSESEQAALCRYFGFDPVLREYVQTFKRLEYYQHLIYSLSYSRMTKRDNATVCYQMENEKFGRVRSFVLLNVSDILSNNVFALVEELSCLQFSNASILAVKETNNICVVPLLDIKETCMFVSFNNSDKSKTNYVCRFPNNLESD